MSTNGVPPLTGGVRSGIAVALVIGMLVSMVFQFAVPVLGPLILRDLDISRAQFGSITAVYFLVGALASPHGGRWCDAIGGRASLLLAIALGSAGLVVAGLANGLVILLVGAAVAGLAASLGNPSTNRVVMRAFDVRTRGTMIGLKQSGTQLGAMLSGALLPPLALVVGWRSALLISGAVGLALAVGTARAVPRHVDPRNPVSVEQKGTPLRSPTLTTLCAFAMLMGLGIGSVNTYLPIYAVEVVGATVARAGLVTTVLGGCGIAARLVWGFSADRLSHPIRVLPAIACGASLGVLLVILAGPGHQALLWLGAALLGTTALGWHGVVMLLAMRTVPDERAGWASGRVVLWFYGGFMASPVPFGALADVTGSYRTGWTGILSVFAVAAVLTGTRAWHAERTARTVA